MQPWKGYWIMRHVETYLFRIQDMQSAELVGRIIDDMQHDMSRICRAGQYAPPLRVR